VRPDEIDNKNRNYHLIFERLLLSLCAAGTILILSWLLKFSSYGIEFTDESFYLVSIANPYLYDWSTTQFGFIYHALYWLLGGDIATLRQANILITFGLTWSLAVLLLKSMTSEIAEQRSVLYITAAGLSTASLIAFESWITTPSYNSLALQSLLTTSIGLMLCKKISSPKSTLGWILIGVGGWLAFMAKPSTACALAIGVFVYLVIARKLSARMIFIAALSAAAPLLLSALLMDGSVLKFIDRLRVGIQFTEYLGAGHTIESIIRLDIFELTPREELVIIYLAAGCSISTLIALSNNTTTKYLSLFPSILLLCLTAAISLDALTLTTGFGKFQTLVIWGIISSMAALGLIGGAKKLSSVTAEQWGIALLFFTMPYIYAFGTNGNYWQTGGAAGVFWLLGGLILLSPLVRVRKELYFTLPLVFAVQSVTATMLQRGFEHPYRQPQALRLNDTPIVVGPSGSSLMLSAGYAQYLADAKTTALNANFISGTPMIDLTGQSPGILYALQAENLGQAWTIGGYPGSGKLAIAALNRSACEKIATAWVLFEPEGPRSLPADVLPALGADFPKNYTEMGSWKTASGAGDYLTLRTQILYAPLAPKQTLDTCSALRSK